MFALIKRVLDLAGSFSAGAAQPDVGHGVQHPESVLHGRYAGRGVLGAREPRPPRRRRGAAMPGHLGCQRDRAVRVPVLVDITMDAQGFHIFRDLRLRVGDRLKAAPMGYFSEQRLSAVTTTLTTTVHQLEEFRPSA
ncbi:MAG: hypothetical protein ACLTMP_05695 [Eggerthella lenta]